MTAIGTVKICEKTLTIGSYVIHYNNEESAVQTVEEVFNELPYIFQTTNERPLIIDGGSNIGISCLYFKMQYPRANVLCFEPDPIAFSLLKKNVAANNLQNVILVNAALSNVSGEINFYGQLNISDPDSRGNSIIDTWGLQRKNSSCTTVASVKLSNYINSEVDFLKLDIEGAEEQVLTEIIDKLPLIRSLALEVHQSEKIITINDIKRIGALLNNNGFDINIIKKSINMLPTAINNWVHEVNPDLYLINAKRKF